MTREARLALEYPIIGPMGTEELQKLHYDRIGTEYESHYGDPCSRQYRGRFIHQPMFKGLDLRGMDVLEAMCGNGQTTEFLVSQGARITGLDISPTEIDSFKERWPNCEAKCASILYSGFASASFDCVAIVGGLHHLHPHLGEAVGEIHRILKAGLSEMVTAWLRDLATNHQEGRSNRRHSQYGRFNSFQDTEHPVYQIVRSTEAGLNDLV